MSGLPQFLLLTLRTRARRMLGLAAFAQHIPLLVLGPFAGVWVDRLRRRPVMIVADVARAALQSLGFACHRLVFEAPGTAPVANLHARIGDAAPNLAFAGHVDVVRPGDASAWRADPFGAEVIAGELFGRGAVDMKGAIACFIAAAARLLAAGWPRGSISLLLTADEERAERLRLEARSAGADPAHDTVGAVALDAAGGKRLWEACRTRGMRVRPTKGSLASVGVRLVSRIEIYRCEFCCREWLVAVYAPDRRRCGWWKCFGCHSDGETGYRGRVTGRPDR